MCQIPTGLMTVLGILGAFGYLLNVMECNQCNSSYFKPIAY